MSENKKEIPEKEERGKAGDLARQGKPVRIVSKPGKKK